MTRRIWVIVIAALSVLIVVFVMYALGASLSAIVALLVGLFLARWIPWLLSIGFKNELEMLKNRIAKLFHLQHEKIIGFPDSVEDGVMYYKKRDRLPLKDLLNKVEQRMEMLSISFTVLVQHIDEIKAIIAKGKQITFLVLNPESENVGVHTPLYIDGSNLKSQIIASLDVLWNLKNDYPENVTIKLYDDLAPFAIMIIDDKLIKVEERPVGRDSNSRPSHLCHKRDNEGYFNLNRRIYDRVLTSASEYNPS